jgi:hypothetical protein
MEFHSIHRYSLPLAPPLLSISTLNHSLLLSTVGSLRDPAFLTLEVLHPPFLASNRNAVGPRSGRAVMPDLGKIRARRKIQDEPEVGAGTAIVILRNECGRVVRAK